MSDSRRFLRRVPLLTTFVGVLTLASAVLADDLKVVPLYDGVAPGSEKWQQRERELKDPKTGQRMVANVVKPTLTVVRSADGKADGSAVVICPGGGFAVLSLDSE